MNSKDFIQALRKVIREEVQVAVRSELSKFGNVIAENRTPVTKVVERPRYTESYKKPTVKKSYSSNPLLNDILNDTEMLESETSMQSLNESIDYRDMSEWPSMNYNSQLSNTRQATIPPVVTDINGNRVSTEALAATPGGAAVIEAITVKDYSAILKAAAAKSKIGR
jgi:hypothetical protein